MFSRDKRISINNNKIFKYFIYAIGEVIVVIVGVLFAISFNNYNNYNNADSKVIEYVRSIQKELLTDKSILEKSLSTAKDQIILLKDYELHLDNLDELPVIRLQEIRNLSIMYPYNDRKEMIFLTTDQGNFSNARKNMQAMINRINSYYEYCNVLDHFYKSSLTLHNKSISYWISTGVDLRSSEKQILIETLSSKDYKNLMLFKKSLIESDEEYLDFCIKFNNALESEILDFLL